MTPTDLANIAALGILAVPVLFFLYFVANAGCDVIEGKEEE